MGKKTWEFSYWANSTQKGGRNQVEKRRKTGDAQVEQSLQHTDQTRGEREREREHESAKAFPFQTSLRTSLRISIDLALGLRAEALFQQLSFYSKTKLEFSFNLFIHEHRNHPTSIWNFHQNHFWWALHVHQALDHFMLKPKISYQC